MAMLRLKWAVMLAVLAVAVGTASGAHRSAPAPVTPVVAAPAPQPTISPECMDAVLNMSDCLPYVESGSTTKHPDKACCPELDGLLQSNPVCLCQLLAGGGESYGVSVDYKRAMALPGVCGLNAPPLSACAAKSLGPLSSPATREAIFLRSPVRSTSPPAARRFPSPPSAASAAGGEGNLGPRRVHSVGFGRDFAGGVREVVARLVLVCCLQVALSPSGLGARWSGAAERFLLRARGPSGSPCALDPLPDLAAADLVDTSEAAGGQTRRRWRRSEAEALRSSRSDDFPSARGSSSIQGVSGEGAAARHRHVSLVVTGIDLQEDLLLEFRLGLLQRH